MRDERKAEGELLRELDALRRRVSELEQAQSAPRHSEKQLKDLFDNAIVGIYRTTPDGRIIMANSAFVRMLGFSSFEELAEKKVDDEGFAPGYPRPTFKDLIEKKGKVIGFESAFLRRDGTTIFVRENARVVLDLSGRVLYYEGVVEDITEHKKVEEGLKQYQLMVESAQDAIFFKDLKSRYIVANKKTLEAFGLSGEQVIGKNDYEIMPNKKEAEKNIEDDNLVFKTGKPTEITKSMTSADGKERWFHGVKVPQFDNEGNVIGLIGIARDITEHKWIEDALRNSELKYRMLLENLPQKIFLKDRDSVYMSCNENYSRDMKIKPEEIAGKTDYDFYSKKLAEKYRSDDKRIMEGGKTENIEEKYIQGGQELIVRTVKTPVKDAKGRVSGILGIFWDITKEKRAQEELQKYREKMVQAEQLASLGALGATLVHELAQPLTVITLSIENA
ncbi:MAG: PAS domain S-box protein, partial [Planctomycetota bacterium]|nr:PAS domain S-box protein [Planctomycetota bacterium]